MLADEHVIGDVVIEVEGIEPNRPIFLKLLEHAVFGVEQILHEKEEKLFGDAPSVFGFLAGKLHAHRLLEVLFGCHAHGVQRVLNQMRSTDLQVIRKSPVTQG